MSHKVDIGERRVVQELVEYKSNDNFGGGENEQTEMIVIYAWKQKKKADLVFKVAWIWNSKGREIDGSLEMVMIWDSTQAVLLVIRSLLGRMVSEGRRDIIFYVNNYRQGKASLVINSTL